DDILMTSLPLFHINAPAYSTLGSIAAGAGLVVLPRFSASTFIDSAREYGATEFNAIGAMIEILMRQPEKDDDADNPLRLCYTGPAPPKERHLEIEERFGFRIVSGYALSETPYATIWRRGTRPYGTLGSVRQHPRLGEINQGRVIGDDGKEVGVGGSGELELKNPAIMLGYYNMPEETDKVLVDGWLKTGDIVEVNDDETFTFLGRKKELIRRRGENLSPLEVQDALEVHPAVVEAAVVGVPSDLSEEEIKAFVVLKEGESVTMAELREFVAGKLAKFKVPRYFEVLDDLPHTPTGRIAKHELPSERTATEEDLDPQ
ncbi:MAG: AMP-binding protein, partial [Actinobacteria bacterium]|nr:AMP-binding protein [Actinomycetota bacterium]